jgi:hypothetical protein
MGNNLKTISLSITSVALTLLINTAALGAPVNIEYEGAGTSTSLDIKNAPSINAGLNTITVDGNSSLALNTSNNSMTATWTATANSYVDVQAGAGQYNHGSKGEEKYSKAGYLFSLLDISESLSTTAAKYNALVNYVIWDILGNPPKLGNSDDRDAADSLEALAKDNKAFDWSATMVVYTANDGSAREFFTVLPPIATPIPSALFLFGSMALGLFGIVTRKQATSA